MHAKVCYIIAPRREAIATLSCMARIWNACPMLGAILFFHGTTIQCFQNRRYATPRNLAGGTAEAAVNGVNRTSHNISNPAVTFVTDRCPGGEMTMEKPFTNHIFIDLRGRDFKDPNWWFVSRRGASRDPGTDVINMQQESFGGTRAVLARS